MKEMRSALGVRLGSGVFGKLGDGESPFQGKEETEMGRCKEFRICSRKPDRHLSEN